MKRTLPILLILVILGIAIYNHIGPDSMEPLILEIDIFEESANDEIEEVFEDGNTENSGGASTIYVENVELINEFLDLDMMLRYKDLVTVYGLTLPKLVTNDSEKHYKDNIELIAEVLGIYNLKEFQEVNTILNEGNLNTLDEISFVRINKINKEGNLLRATLMYMYGEKAIELTHYINYVFINGEPQIFIYN